MPVIKLGERAEITLPDELRRALNVGAGDALKAEMVGGGLLLTPVTSEEVREAAWKQVEEVMGSARYVGPGPEPSDEELMRSVVEGIKEARRARREGRSR